MSWILCVRNRIGRSVIEAVLTDFDRNGATTVQILRQADPAGYSKVLRDLLRAEAGDGTRGKGRRPRAQRTRAAAKLLAALEADFALHGQDAIAALRETRPQAWARLLSEACQFKLLPKTPKLAPQREPRPVRMKSLLQAMAEQPVDPTSALLPMRQAEALPTALAAVPHGTWPQPVEVWRQAFGQAWDNALAHWLAIHLPSALVLPEDHDPGERSRPKPETGPGTVGDWLDAFRAADRDEVDGDGFVMRRR